MHTAAHTRNQSINEKGELISGTSLKFKTVIEV